MAEFKWTKKRSEVAILLSLGYTGEEIAEKAKIGKRTIYRWKNHPEFAAEIERLSLMTDIAGRAERLRIAKRVIRQMQTEGKIKTSKDLLDWLKYAQGETDGIKLDLAALIEAATSRPDSGLGGTGENKPEESEPSADSTD